MRISTQTSWFFARMGDVRGVHALARIGYDALDYSMFYFPGTEHPFNGPGYERHMHMVRKAADGSGISFNQTHAPFPSYRPGDTAYNEKTFNHLVRAIEVTALLGAKYVVVHPVALEKDQKEFNMEFFGRLAPFCREFGVMAAVENMFAWDNEKDCGKTNVCSTAEEFLDYMESLDPRCFTACLDIGHAGLVGETPAGMIEALGAKHLKSLHVHDNDNRYDLHQLPFTGKIDWKQTMAALWKTGYEGELTFEADRFLMGFPDGMLEQASAFMLETGRHLAGLMGDSSTGEG
ncbi:MAG: sugar phosphate isomerase/epimerase family protein [Clostridia bacterium]